MSWRSLQRKSNKEPDLWPLHWALGSRLLHPFHLNVRNGLKFSLIWGQHTNACSLIITFSISFEKMNCLYRNVDAVMADEPELPNMQRFFLTLRTCDSKRCISAFCRPDYVCGLAPVGPSVLLLLALDDPQEEE